jgi:hypothetical protein
MDALPGFLFRVINLSNRFLHPMDLFLFLISELLYYSKKDELFNKIILQVITIAYINLSKKSIGVWLL